LFVALKRSCFPIFTLAARAARFFEKSGAKNFTRMSLCVSFCEISYHTGTKKLYIQLNKTACTDQVQVKFYTFSTVLIPHIHKAGVENV